MPGPRPDEHNDRWPFWKDPPRVQRGNPRLLRLPYPKRSSADHLRPLVHATILAGTEVIGVDDIYFLIAISKDGRVVSNHMKHLSSVLNVTFVFGGVDIKKNHLLTEGRVGDGRAQTGRRWSHQMYDCSPLLPTSRCGARMAPVTCRPVLCSGRCDTPED